MIRVSSGALMLCVAVSSAHAGDAPSCRATSQPGQKIETRFMGLDYGIMMLALAEKYCGAKHKPMAPRFLGYLKKQGCGPDTEVYRNISTSIKVAEAADLKMLAAGGNPKIHVSYKQARDWAAGAAKSFGGCEKLIALHDSKMEWPK